MHKLQLRVGPSGTGQSWRSTGQTGAHWSVLVAEHKGSKHPVLTLMNLFSKIQRFWGRASGRSPGGTQEIQSVAGQVRFWIKLPKKSRAEMQLCLSSFSASSFES